MKAFPRWISAALSVALMAVLLLPAAPAAARPLANGDDALRQSYTYQINGDVVAAGVGLRGTGTGTISLTGIPSGATVYRAYLYWATLGSLNSYTSPLLNSQPAPGMLIGTTADTGWNVAHNYVYRADVTNLVAGNGNYTVNGLPSDLVGGNDSQGASLVVIYARPGDPLHTIVLTDGAVALNSARPNYTHVITGFTAPPSVGSARAIYLIGDGQNQWDSDNLSFNSQPLADGVFSGVDGDFWGTHSFDVTSRIASGSTSASTTLRNNNPADPGTPDYLLWAATIFSISASAPQTSNQMAESYKRSLFGDVTAAGVGLRGSGAGEIRLRGMPANASVARAFLYWATIGNNGSYTNPQLNGQTVSGQRIGTSADTCWYTSANFVYRADVTDRVSGNGDYTISGLPSNLASGDDSQGASLVVVYYSPGLFRTVIINDGAVTLDLVTNSYTTTLGSFTADQPAAQAHVTYLIGDGQEQWANGQITFDGNTITDSVFNAPDGNYWGTLRFNVTGMISEPDASTTINNNPPGITTSPDCLLWAGTILSVESEPPLLTFLPLAMK